MVKGKDFKSKINANGTEISIISKGTEEDYTIHILNWSNSTSLKMKQDQIRLYFHLKSG